MNISRIFALSIALSLSFGATAHAGGLGDLVSGIHTAGGLGSAVKVLTTAPPRGATYQQFQAKRECFRVANQSVPRMQELQERNRGKGINYADAAEFVRLRDANNAATARCAAMPNGTNVTHR